MPYLGLDTRFRFQPVSNLEGHFRLRVFSPLPDEPGPILAVASLPEEHGVPGPLNFVEEAATGVWKQIVQPMLSPGADPASCFAFVCQIPEDEREPESFIQAVLAWAGDTIPLQSVRWRHLTRDSDRSYSDQIDLAWFE